VTARGQDMHAGAVVSTDDVVEQVSSPFTLAPGHPLRRMRCLICAMMVGGREVRSAVVIDYRHDGCRCGSVPAVAYLICSEHESEPDLNIGDPAIARYHQHHPARRSA
jgi:hypothetical protein